MSLIGKSKAERTQGSKIHFIRDLKMLESGKKGTCAPDGTDKNFFEFDNDVH